MTIVRTWILPQTAQPPPPPLVGAFTIITPPTLPAATVGATYSYTLSASGGIPPYSWQITSIGANQNWNGWLTGGNPYLPYVLTGGTVAGWPQQPETVTFTVQVQDSSPSPQVLNENFTIVVIAA